MRWKRVSAAVCAQLFVVAANAGLPALAATTPPDGEIARLIVGSWIADPNEPDAIRAQAQEVQRRSIIIYDADHTGSFDIYSDTTCKTLVRSIHFIWAIDHGVLGAQADYGISSYDAVESIDPELMILRLLGGSGTDGAHPGIIQRRVRAADCATPESLLVLS